MVGTWRKGPGKPLFDSVKTRLGAAAPFIMAEDLGVITEDVRALRRAIDAPGMVVLQVCRCTSSILRSALTHSCLLAASLVSSSSMLCSIQTRTCRIASA